MKEIENSGIPFPGKLEQDTEYLHKNAAAVLTTLALAGLLLEAHDLWKNRHTIAKASRRLDTPEGRKTLAWNVLPPLANLIPVVSPVRKASKLISAGIIAGGVPANFFAYNKRNKINRRNRAYSGGDYGKGFQNMPKVNAAQIYADYWNKGNKGNKGNMSNLQNAGNTSNSGNMSNLQNAGNTSNSGNMSNLQNMEFKPGHDFKVRESMYNRMRKAYSEQ